jgi:hypothetical protein
MSDVLCCYLELMACCCLPNEQHCNSWTEKRGLRGGWGLTKREWNPGVRKREISGGLVCRLGFTQFLPGLDPRGVRSPENRTRPEVVDGVESKPQTPNPRNQQPRHTDPSQSKP